jgi:Growth inhibitor
MKVSRSRLFVIALEDFIQEQENRELLEKINAVYADEPDESEKELRRKMCQSYRRLVGGAMVINQGDIYWVELNDPVGSEPGYIHPNVVIQNNLYNQSKIHTVIICGLTSNLKYAQSPGNVLLEESEANLPKASVVNVSQLLTVDKTQLGEYIGTLSKKRLYQVLQGVTSFLEPRDLNKL